MTSIAPHLAAPQQQQIDPIAAQQLIQGQLAQQQALLAQQQRQYPQQQMTPYGFFGDLAGSVLPQMGSWVGQQFGSPQLGQQVGGIAGQLAQQFSPWQAGPSAVQQYPQQMPVQQYPQQMQQYPQQYVPQTPQMQQQMTPYGFFGDLAGSVLPQVGSWVGQQFGSPQLGQQVGGIAGQLAQTLSPWQAGPSSPQAQYPQAQQAQQAQHPQAQYPQAQYPQAQYPQAQQLAPFGLFGGLAGSFLGGLGGRAIGDLLGNPQIGESVGRGAGGILGGIMPFGVSPAQVNPAQVNPAQYAGYPQQPGVAYHTGYIR